MISNQDRPIFPQKASFKNYTKTGNPQIYYLKAEEELRVWEIQDFLRLRLLEGQAEIFGRELPLMETVIYYKGENLAIFTWKGAKIEIEDHEHVYHEPRPANPQGEWKTQMRELVNINHVLE